MSTHEIDYEKKYIMQKKLYDKLLYLRCEVVKIDSENLRRKIEEHKQIHKVCTDELKLHNQRLENDIKDTEKIKSEFKKIKESIGRLKNELSRKDPTFSVIFNFEDIRAINLINSHTYQFEIGENDTLKFTLEKRDNDFKYMATHVPKWIEGDFGKSFTFDKSELEGFCYKVVNLYQDSKKV